MKVRCIQLLDSTGHPEEKSHWLTLGKVYHVMTLTFGTQKKWLLRLIGDGRNGLALFPLEQFEIVSSNIPAAWVIRWEKGVFELSPEPWNQPGFWERYYERDPDAIRVFEEESRRIIQQDS